MVEICVVQCYSCSTFQGQQVKKEKKWSCKMCGEKQSFRKIFGQGSGKECRLHVQKLNAMKGNLDREMEMDGYLGRKEMVNDFESVSEEISVLRDSRRTIVESKWQQFVDQLDLDEIDEDNDDEEDCSVTTDREHFKKKAQKRKSGSLSEEHKPKTTRKINQRPSSRYEDLSNKTVRNDAQHCSQRKALYHDSEPKRQFHSPEIKPENISKVKQPSKWSIFT